jgi:hypothetical protein
MNKGRGLLRGAAADKNHGQNAGSFVAAFNDISPGQRQISRHADDHGLCHGNVGGRRSPHSIPPLQENVKPAI